MRVVFNIKYNTVWGQSLCIVGSVPELGEWEDAIAPEMIFAGDGLWKLELDLPDNLKQVDYFYCVRSEGEVVSKEWNRGHTLPLNDQNGCCIVYDAWLDIPVDLPFYSSAFTEALFYHQVRVQDRLLCRERLTISVFAPRVGKQEYIALTGDQDKLGNWQPSESLRMYPAGGAIWNIALDASEITFPLTYKFLICNEQDKSSCIWEEGENRILNYPFLTDTCESAFVSGLSFRYAPIVDFWKGAGTVIPVFSLRSDESYGVGDLGDLRLFIDWIKKTGQCIVQVLPMNDTRMTKTWLDSYPYSAMSIYALHPMYINLRQMGLLNDPERNVYYQNKQQELNAKEEIDYEAVVDVKMAYCKEFINQEGFLKLIDNDEFRLFFERNGSWLVPYAAYCYLRDKYGTADFSRWEKYASYDKAEITRLCSPTNPAYPEIALNYYLQYIVDKQFREVTAYARMNGVVLKGDLPIGVNRHSAEVWTEPDYFNLNGQSGAPPDDFSVVGQNWLFPTYRWDIMKMDEYAWWRKRFAKMNDYFDCFRIDHILGFFRIWEIPEEYVQGLCGHFNPSLPFSINEIEQFGLCFDEKRFTSPHINQHFLPDLFAEYTDEVKGSYLAQSSSNHFVLKSFCDTQRKIEHLFEGKNDPKSIRIKAGLFAIANEVLFLRDPNNEDFFHPRISASSSFLYRELTGSEKDAYNHLYENFFYHRHNQFWKEQAYEKLGPLVDSTEMLVCGEDLGMIPATVPEVMTKLQLLSLEIERMPKAFGVEFADLTSLPYFSVCTTSTHDMSPIRSWWTEDRNKTQRYYNNVLKREGEAPEECTGDIAKQILLNHLSSPSMLTIIPWQDWLAIDEQLRRPDAKAERINIPAQTNHYWRYRMHLTIEQLLQADSLNERISSLINGF